MAARIQRLQPGEGDRWRRIRLRALHDAPYAFCTTHAEVSQWPAERWEAQVVDFATFVATVDSRDVGVARGALHPRSDVRALHSMWIDAAVRRQGVGAQLVESVAAWAKADGANALVLDVVEGNAPAIALYERTGFRQVEGDAMGEQAPGEIRLVRWLVTLAE